MTGKKEQVATKEDQDTAFDNLMGAVGDVSTALEPTGTGSNALAQVPEGYDLEDLGAGFEEITAADMLIPFFRILQTNSPEVMEGNSKFIENAKANSFLNTATGKLIPGKSGFVFVPVHRTHQFLEYIPRDQGGGLVAIHDPKSQEVLDIIKKVGGNVKGKLKIGDGNELVETYTFYGLVSDDAGQVEFGAISFASTSISIYKGIITKLDMLRQFVPGRGKLPLPMFASKLRVTTRFSENKKGAWFKIQADFEGGSAEAARIDKNDPIFVEAKKFRSLVVEGRAAVDQRQNTDALEDAEIEVVGTTDEAKTF